MSGWIKLHRQIVNSSKFADPDILRLWILCLTKASHKETVVVIDKREIQLTPGQFVTGRFSLDHDYNALLSPKKRIPKTTLWNWLKRLEEWGDLDIKTTNKYSVVTVLKWNDYQDTLTTDGQQIDNRWTTDGQQIGTNKNVKNLENLKNEKNKDIKEYSSETLDLTNHLIDLMKLNNPNVKIPSDLNNWHDAMDKLQRLDKYEYLQIRSIIDWCQNDTFWKSNILSTPKLREKMGTLLLQKKSKTAEKPRQLSQYEKMVKRLEAEEVKKNGSNRNYETPYDVFG